MEGDIPPKSSNALEPLVDMEDRRAFQELQKVSPPVCPGPKCCARLVFIDDARIVLADSVSELLGDSLRPYFSPQSEFPELGALVLKKEPGLLSKENGMCYYSIRLIRSTIHRNSFYKYSP